MRWGAGAPRAWLCLAASLCAAAGGLDRRAAARVRTPPRPDVTPAPTIADPDLARILDEADRLIKEGAHDEAARLIQSLIDQRDSGFVPAPDGHRLIPFRRQAAELLGSAGPEALAAYRSLYDAKVQTLYARALADRDEAALRDLADRYLHATRGPDVLAALGNLCFDSARFAVAAMSWRRAVDAYADQGSAAMCLAKTAVALHLDGQLEAARATAGELKTRYPDAAGLVAGGRQDLSTFVDRVMELGLVRQETGPAGQPGQWPGLGAMPGSTALMADCDVIPRPEWRLTPEKGLLAMQGWLDHQAGAPYRSIATERNGHVHVASKAVSKASVSIPGEFFLPASVEPLVMGNVVICRWDEGLAAYELAGQTPGRCVWRSQGLPLHRPKLPLRPTHRWQRKLMGIYGADVPGMMGEHRYALTADRERVYLLAGLAPVGVPTGGAGPLPTALQAGKGKAAERVTSTLAAVSLAAGGKLVWSVNDGKDTDDLVRWGEFLAAPAVHNGRVYSVVLLAEAYHLVCLSAEDGRMLWQVEMPTMIVSLHQGLPPMRDGAAVTVADGLVIVCTNAGLVAAYDAVSGAAAWAYRYESTTARSHTVTESGINWGHHAVNPVIVSNGRVVCLPADSLELFALSLVDGHRLWPVLARGIQAHLSAVDADRVLMSSPGLVVVSAATGQVIHQEENLEIVGRPAVSAEAIMASGQGRLIRMSLSDYSLEPDRPIQAGGLLGNLVAVEGRLIAANAVGVCVYADYEAAWLEATRRIELASRGDRARAIFMRARVSFRATKYDKALEDLRAAAELAEKTGGEDLPAAIRSLQLRAYVGKGSQAEMPEQIAACFREAAALARTDQEKAQVQMRQAKYEAARAKALLAEARAKRAAGHAGAAEALSARAVSLLAGAVGRARYLAQAAPMTARHWALQQFVPTLLRTHGRAFYAAFDAEAGAAFTAALAAGDPKAMLAVARHWPNSQWADRARFEAGSLLYGQAVAAAKTPNRALLSAALEPVATAAATADPHLGIRALAVRAAVYNALGQKSFSRQLSGELRSRCAAGRVDLSETVRLGRGPTRLSDLLAELSPGAATATPRTARTIHLPLAPRFSFTGTNVYMVRDQGYRPVRQGKCLLVMKDRVPVWLNTEAASAEQAVVWTGSVGVQDHYLGYAGRNVVGGLSSDGRLVAIADTRSVSAFDVTTGRALWTKKMSAAGISAAQFMGVGGGVLAAVGKGGEVACIDLATGEGSTPAIPKTSSARDRTGTPPGVGGGLVLLRARSGRAATCINVAGDGTSCAWTDSGGVDARLVADGLVAVLFGGKLRLYDRAQLTHPLWTKQYDQAARPEILSVANGRIVVAEGMVSPWVQVVGISGSTVARVRALRPSEQSWRISGAMSGGRYLYATVGIRFTNRGAGHATTDVPWQAPVVRKLDMSTSAVLWDGQIGGNAYIGHRNVPLVLADNAVIIVIKPVLATLHSRLRVLFDPSDDETIHMLPLVPHRASRTRGEWAYRLRRIGPPVFVGANLCVETTEGVSVYGPKP